jgi:hypothetical protein
VVAKLCFSRHADIAITAAHYVDRLRQATSGLGALLKAVNDEKIIPLEEEPTAGIKRRGTHRRSLDAVIRIL